MAHRILVINPGSTSTKIAIFEGSNQIYKETLRHSTEVISSYPNVSSQKDFRYEAIVKALETAGVGVETLDAVMGRGGLVKPNRAGSYVVNDKMISDLANAVYGEHASNLGAILADTIARQANLKNGNDACKAYIADPVTVDELSDIARMTGHPKFPKQSIFHALNSRAVVRRYAKECGKKADELNVIVAHLGGGVSISLHEKGMTTDVNDALNGEGPFSPERTGGVTALTMAKMCFSGEYTYDQIKRMIVGEGGAVAHLGTNDFFKVEDDYKAGDPATIRFVDSLAYHVAKSIGGLAAAVSGKVDAIILTGGIAYYRHLCDMIAERVSFLAPVVHYPGEDEMQALAECAEMVLDGETKARIYE